MNGTGWARVKANIEKVKSTEMSMKGQERKVLPTGLLGVQRVHWVSGKRAILRAWSHLTKRTYSPSSGLFEAGELRGKVKREGRTSGPRFPSYLRESDLNRGLREGIRGVNGEKRLRSGRAWDAWFTAG